MLSQKDIEENKKLIVEMLIATGREGIEALIGYLEKSGFFKSPSSTKYHGAYKGGLARHSLNVWGKYVDLMIESGVEVDANSVTIACLLHDVCKVGLYAGKKAPYTYNSRNYYGHAKLSLKRVSRFIHLTDTEYRMIKYHMGIYGAMNKNGQRDEYTLIRLKDALNDHAVKLMCFADELATICEKQEEAKCAM